MALVSHVNVILQPSSANEDFLLLSEGERADCKGEDKSHISLFVGLAYIVFQDSMLSAHNQVTKLLPPMASPILNTFYQFSNFLCLLCFCCCAVADVKDCTDSCFTFSEIRFLGFIICFIFDQLLSRLVKTSD